MTENTTQTHNGTVFPGFAGGWKRVAASMLDGIFSILVIPIFINLFFYFSRGQTLGKMCMHCKIVDADGNVPKFSKLLIRALVKFLIGMVPFGGLVHIMIFVDDHKQGLHDKAGKTFVVQTKSISSAWTWAVNILSPLLLFLASMALSGIIAAGLLLGQGLGVKDFSGLEGANISHDEGSLETPTSTDNNDTIENQAPPSERPRTRARSTE